MLFLYYIENYTVKYKSHIICYIILVLITNFFLKLLYLFISYKNMTGVVDILLYYAVFITKIV